MDFIIFGILIGTIYGRNMGEINRRTYADVCRAALAFSRTGFALGLYYMVEAIYTYFERKFVQKTICTNDILCECNRRKCRPLKIDTYVRKIKAAN